MNRLTHARVWSAIGALAHRYGLSASGLAKRAGLDPTSFNKSKRVTGEGRPRWPTTESIAKSSPLTASTGWRASCGRASSRKPEIGSRGPRMARSVTSDA
jgi:phage repressor protein C with HTH and peptisase S24 domain